MCTAVTYASSSRYFGRNLDIDTQFEESLVCMPREYRITVGGDGVSLPLAVFGVATVADGMPLFYDAANECGIGAAGLNFTENACHLPPVPDKTNLASHELIPYVLGLAKNMGEVRELLGKINITPDAPRGYPPARLHYMFTDGCECITAEPLAEGLRIYENTVGTLTNDPPFEFHMHNLARHAAVSRNSPKNEVEAETGNSLGIKALPLGSGFFGIPGDLTSPSRFVRAALTRLFATKKDTEADSVSQMLHILSSVSMTEGCVVAGSGRLEKTLYTTVVNLDTGTYYYTSYGNPAPRRVRFSEENMSQGSLTVIKMELD